MMRRCLEERRLLWRRSLQRKQWSEAIRSVPWEVAFEILLSALQKSQGLLNPYRGLFSHTGPVTTPHPDIRSPLHHYFAFWS